MTTQLASAGYDPQGNDAAQLPRDVDGVAVFAPSLIVPAGFLQRLARRMGRPARRIVVGPSIVDLLRATRGALAGVVGARRSPALRAYQAP